MMEILQDLLTYPIQIRLCRHLCTLSAILLSNLYPTQNRADSRDQLIHDKGLGDVIICAIHNGIDFVIHPGAGGKKYERNGSQLRVETHQFAKFKPIRWRHHYIRKDQVWLDLLRLCKSIVPILCGNNLKSMFFNGCRNSHEQGRVIINDQNKRLGIHVHFSACNFWVIPMALPASLALLFTNIT